MKNQTMKNIIYALIDPRNDLVYYVGKSSVNEKRPLSHLFNTHSEKVNEWIKELESKWFYPKIQIIENVEKLDELPEREVYWIQYYSNLNPFILNIHHNTNLISYELIEKEEQEDFEVIQRTIGNIHKILKKQRIARKINQDDLSEIMNSSRSTISLFERGENVNLDIVKKYVIALRALEMKSKILTKERVSKNE